MKKQTWREEFDKDFRWIGKRYDSSVCKFWIDEERIAEVKDFISSLLTKEREAVIKMCREIYINDVDWAEWGVSDERAWEKFDESVEEAQTALTQLAKDNK